MGRKKLAVALGSTEQKIRTALAMLVNMEILTIESTNEFSRITLKNWEKYQVREIEQPAEQPKLNQQLTTVKEGKKVEEEKKDPETFDVWWKLYPNKGSKKTALKAWLKLKPNTDLEAVLIKDIEVRATSEKWTKDGGAYVPLGATYLNNERWKDPMPTDIQAAKNTPVCSHPRATFHVQETYGNGSVYGICGACKKPVTLPKEAA